MSNIGVAVPTQEEAVKIALEVSRMEAALKQMKQRLKDFVDVNGPLTAGDCVWDYSKSISWKFEADKLKEMAEWMVLEAKNPWELLSLPAESLKKLGWQESTLAQYGKMKETRRFDSRKAGK